MNTKSTIESFEMVLIPMINKLQISSDTMVMDNASCHTSNQTLKWIENKFLKFVPPAGEPKNVLGGFPPNSPDCNPIELIWNLVQERVSKKPYNNLDEFMEVIKKEWEKVTMEEIRPSIDRQKNVLNFIVETDGEFFRD